MLPRAAIIMIRPDRADFRKELPQQLFIETSPQHQSAELSWLFPLFRRVLR